MSDCSIEDTYDSFDLISLTPSSPPPDSISIRVGQACFWGTVFAGCTACVADLCCQKKKRTILPYSSLTDQPMVVSQPDNVSEPASPPKPPSSPLRQESPELPTLKSPQEPPVLLLSREPCNTLPELEGEQKKALTDLIEHMGALKYGWLLWNGNAIENKIIDIHPFQFLGTIFGTHLKRHMPIVFNDFFTRNGFLSGVKKGMTRDFHKLDPYMDWFCDRVGTTRENILPFIEKRDWHNLVGHLVSLVPTNPEQKT